MSRRKIENIQVEAWPKLRVGQLYRGKVTKVSMKKRPNRLIIVIENMTCPQLGRIHEIELGLPVHPGNPTSLFLSACGIDANRIGTVIHVEHIVNCIVGLKYRGQGFHESVDFSFEILPDLPDQSTFSHQPPIFPEVDD